MAPSLAMDVSLRVLAERSRSPPPARRLPEAVPEAAEWEEPEEAAGEEEEAFEEAFEAAAGDRVLQVSPAPPPLAGWQVVDVWPAAAAGGGAAPPPEDATVEALPAGGLRRRLQASPSPGAVVPQGPRAAAAAAAAADLDGGIVHKVRRASKIAELLATEPTVIVGVVQDVAARAHLFGRESLAAWIVSFALLIGAFVVACLLWIRDGPHVV